MKFLVSDSAGNSVTTPSFAFTVQDPYSLTFAGPSSMAQSTSAAYTVNVVPNSGFTGTVLVTPTANVAGQATFSPTGPVSVTISSSATMSATFTVTTTATAGGTFSLGANTSVQGQTFTLNQTPSTTQITISGAPFSIAVQGGVLPRFFSGVAVQVPVVVTFATGYVGSVTVTSAGFATAIASITAPTVVASSNGVAGSVTLTFTVTGQGPQINTVNGTGSFIATDGTTHLTATTGSLGYPMIDPYRLGFATVPTTMASSTSATLVVNIQTANGFSGVVNVAGAANPAGFVQSFSGPSSVTVASASSNPVTFTVTLDPNLALNSQFNLGLNTSTGASFVLNGLSPTATTVVAPFSLSATPNPLAVSNGVTSNLTVTVTFAAGYVGSVTVSCSSVTASGVAVSNVGPAAKRPDGRRVAAVVSGCSGLGLGSVAPDAANSSATVSSNGSSGPANLIFDVTGSGGGTGVINFQGSDTAGNSATYKAPFTAQAAPPGGGSVTAGSTTDTPGNSVNVPITLSLSSGVTVDGVSFGFQVTANGSAPAITTGTLSFVPGGGMPAPSLVDTSAGPNIINVSWLNLTTALSGNVALGNVVVKIPATSISGQSYTVNITGARGSLGSTAVTLVAGPNGLLSIPGASPASLRNANADKRDRMTVVAHNESCTGVRFDGGSQSGCGGSVDVEIQPVITAAGGLEVRLSTPNGGIRDLGAMPLAGAQLPAASEPGQALLQPQGLFQQGHTYLMKVGNQLALVRVARIRSSVDYAVGGGPWRRCAGYWQPQRSS